jgi:hypothetical protein
MTEPSLETRELASHVSAILREQTPDWREAFKVVQLVLAYMFAAIKDDEEKAWRMADLANGAIALSKKFGAAIKDADEADEAPPETLQ